MFIVSIVNTIFYIITGKNKACWCWNKQTHCLGYVVESSASSDVQAHDKYILHICSTAQTFTQLMVNKHSNTILTNLFICLKFISRETFNIIYKVSV